MIYRMQRETNPFKGSATLQVVITTGQSVDFVGNVEARLLFLGWDPIVKYLKKIDLLRNASS